MLFLKRNGLTASILDPIVDQSRLGSRYCTGCYLWQVEDDSLGPIFNSPTLPEKANGFDGQGAPDVFEIALGSDKAQVGDEVCVIGVGRVKRESMVKPFHVRNNFKVTEFTRWDVDVKTDQVTMRTRQQFAEYDLELIRTMSLSGRKIRNSSTLRNLGKSQIPLRWFAHPFFPWTENLCRFSVECSMPDNPGFKMGEHDFVNRHLGHDWNEGWFQPLQLSFGFPVQIGQMHPTLGKVGIECDFPVAWMPIWGNTLTFSFEPYYHTIVEPGAQAEWNLSYQF